MKKKITAALLFFILLLETVSLTSCVLFDPAALSDLQNQSGNKSEEDSVINVEGGDDYDITINAEDTSDRLATNKALLSAVSIHAKFKPYASKKEYGSAGAGVIYKLDKENGTAYVITNYHVIYDSASNTANRISGDISVYLYGQENEKYAMPAQYVGGSMYYDIAILKIKSNATLMASNAVAAKFANSDEVSVGETAIAIGNPESSGISATFGHISVDSEYITMLSLDEKSEISQRVIRTDAPVNSGNSGGGLFNSSGEIIGIVNAKISKSTVENIGYAIPSNVAKYIAENIIYYCDGKDCESVRRCLFGITVESTEYYTEYDTETGKLYKREKVSVNALENGSHVKGKLEAGDIIKSITIDGTKYEVTRLHHIIDTMLNARPNSTITLEILRGDAAMDVTITATESMLESYS